MSDRETLLALRDIAAGRDMTDDMVVGVRAALRHVVSHLDRLAAVAAPDGSRTNRDQRVRRAALQGAANELADVWIAATREGFLSLRARAAECAP